MGNVSILFQAPPTAGEDPRECPKNGRPKRECGTSGNTGATHGRGSLCQSGFLIAGLKLTLANLGKASEGEQELTLAFSTEGTHRSAATTATGRSNHPPPLNCLLKIQSSGRSVQVAVLGDVPMSTQGKCLPPTKTTPRRDVPEMEKTAKAQANVHSGLNATLGSLGNMGHIELLHGLGLFTTSPHAS